jgi:hypothetical protein
VRPSSWCAWGWRVEEARFEFWRWRQVGCLVDIFFFPPSCCRNHRLSLGVAVAIVNDRAEWSSTHSIESLIESRVAIFNCLSRKAKGRPENQTFVTRAPTLHLFHFLRQTGSSIKELHPPPMQINVNIFVGFGSKISRLVPNKNQFALHAYALCKYCMYACH